MPARSIFRSLLLLAVTAAAPAAVAGKDHLHQHATGPHGGAVESLGDGLHVEAVRKGETIFVYVLDGAGTKDASLTQHDGGSITVVAPGGKPQRTEIEKGSAFSKAELKVPASGTIAVMVSVKIAGKSVTAKLTFD
jgi:hypothetical protein